MRSVSLIRLVASAVVTIGRPLATQGAGVGGGHPFHAMVVTTGMTTLSVDALNARMVPAAPNIVGARRAEHRGRTGRVGERPFPGWGGGRVRHLPDWPGGRQQQTKPNGCSRIRQPVRFVFSGVEVLTLRDAERLPE